MMSSGTAIATSAGRFARRNRALLAFGAALWSAAAAVAFLVPVNSGQRSLQSGMLSADTSATVAEAEDLTNFLTSERWGVSLAAIRREQALAAGESQLPESQDVGYLGFATREDRTTVLLRMPDGSLDERTLGEELPDGRRLTALGETRLTVRDRNQAEEQLLLFPDVTDYTNGDSDTAHSANAELEAPP